MFRGSSPAFNSTKQFQVVRQQAFYNEGRLVGKYKRRFKLIKWWNSRSKLHSLFSAHKLSHKISSIVGLKVMIVALNVFKFMAQKQLIGFRSHQEHF